MALHIHIHSATRDAGFDESQHKRDHGKFTSTGGTSKQQPKEYKTTHGDQAAHFAAAERLYKEYASHGQNATKEGTKGYHLFQASLAHSAAAHDLRDAKRNIGRAERAHAAARSEHGEGSSQAKVSQKILESWQNPGQKKADEAAFHEAAAAKK